MATITLGTISPSKVSLFNIGATTRTGVNLIYKYHSGTLPPGLSLQSDGAIVGECGDVSEDTTYTFTVKAETLTGTLNATQTYGIKVKVLTTDTIANLYGHLYVDQTSLASWKGFVSDSTIFPFRSLYRPTESHFNTLMPKFLFLAGVHSGYLSALSDLMVTNNYNTTLYMGEIKLAKAKAQDGTVLYEVLYCELIDPLAGGPNKITLTANNLPAITVDLRAGSTHILASSGLPIPYDTADNLYLNAVTRMQNEIKSGLTVENFEYLPQWMKSPQEDKLVPGYKLALPIRYVKPGEGATILYKIKNESTYDIQSLVCKVDRWITDRNIGTTIDASTYRSTHTGDGSTRVFAIPYDIARSNSLTVTVGGVTTLTQTTRDLNAGTELSIGDSSTVSAGDTADATNTLTNTEPFTYQTEFMTNTTADSTDTLCDNSNTKSSVNLTQLQLSFNTAPVSGSAIVITLNKTTFGKNLTTIFDDGAGDETTFDGDGTVFTNDLVTLDRKAEQSTQLLMQRSSITDRITHISKQRKLLRTA